MSKIKTKCPKCGRELVATCWYGFNTYTGGYGYNVLLECLNCDIHTSETHDISVKYGDTVTSMDFSVDPDIYNSMISEGVKRLKERYKTLQSPENTRENSTL